MALSTFSLTLTLSIISIWAVVDSAHYQPAAPSPSSSSSPTEDCSSLILNIADCLSFVSSGSQVRTPEVTCCIGLKTVIQTDGDCLCEAFKSSASLGVALNLTRASTLPALCTIPASSVPKCALSLVPAGAPGVQPSPTADAPTTASGGASEAAPAPAPAPSKSGSPVLSVSTGSLVVGLLIIMLV